MSTKTSRKSVKSKEMRSEKTAGRRRGGKGTTGRGTVARNTRSGHRTSARPTGTKKRSDVKKAHNQKGTVRKHISQAKNTGQATAGLKNAPPSLLETISSKSQGLPFRGPKEVLDFADHLLQTLREIFLILSSEMTVLGASPLFYETFQISPQETLGKSLFQLANRQWDIPVLRKLLLTVLPQRTTIEGFRVKHDFPGIGQRIIMLDARTLPIGDGEERFILLGMEDVTRREIATEELRQSEALFKLALDTYPYTFIIYDPDRRIRFTNTYTQKLLKRRPEELVGRLSEELHPPELLDLFLPLQKKAFREKRRVTAEHTMTFPGGTRRLQYSFVPMLNDQGQLIKMLSFAHDMTERREWERKLEASEKLYRMLYEDSPAFKTIIGQDGTILDAGRTAVRSLGYKKRDIVGKPFIDFIAPQHRKMAANLVNRALAGLPIPETDLLLRARDGSLRTIMFSPKYTAIHREGETGGFLFTGLDVTERKRIEEENIALNQKLLNQTNQLADANQELETFVYSVSHDFRAPMRRIGGFTQALLEDCADQLNPKAQDYINRIRRAVGDMSDLMDDLLTLSRTIRQKIRSEQFDLCPLAREIFENLRSQEARRQVTLTMPDKLMINGDRILLGVVLENLLSNAWKFTKKRLRAKIELGTITKDGQSACYVRDNGVGFSMRYLDRLFLPFQQLHTSKDYPGTGLGLAIANRIIKRHNGWMWAEGKVGRGAIFYFTVGDAQQDEE